MVMRKMRVEREARTVMVFSRRHASTNSTWYSRWVKMVECTFSGCTRFICGENNEVCGRGNSEVCGGETVRCVEGETVRCVGGNSKVCVEGKQVCGITSVR